mmetsp:Transcript_79260/g.157599  ORF Transcript_79260/g.157599 Transcript_79260/m.157599 type:complete len:141 (-) Transcript_79260:392-814(-)|eukprot:CAMPEP_0174711672 /NCGR_PEP_ID=MMETSP1094-20130205/12919_1 /TAXON_ID=156173 /ORGANISM="Chrysochromulina brevifilum, Strain UTEX LB 985" /LENGTH=140 /DNA_ID=CAMNT_0015910641 /DNA_START=93 /DNA_END=515 /DNA_ORIENTATION=-
MVWLLVAISITAAPAGTNTTAWCCTWCSAGGCSAKYSSEDLHVPITAGMCIKGGEITPIPHHGENCGEPTYCCECCGAGGCSAWYDISDEQPGTNCGCAKDSYIAPVDPTHGYQCKARNSSAPSLTTGPAAGPSMIDKGS